MSGPDARKHNVRVTPIYPEVQICQYDDPAILNLSVLAPYLRYGYSRLMDTKHAIQMMSALAQPTRLRVASALAKRFPSGMAVGDLAKLADTPPNTMSSHLAILSRAGVIAAQRSGRMVEYSASRDALRKLAEFLTSLSPETEAD